MGPCAHHARCQALPWVVAHLIGLFVLFVPSFLLAGAITCYQWRLIEEADDGAVSGTVRRHAFPVIFIVVSLAILICDVMVVMAGVRDARDSCSTACPLFACLAMGVAPDGLMPTVAIACVSWFIGAAMVVEYARLLSAPDGAHKRRSVRYIIALMIMLFLTVFVLSSWFAVLGEKSLGVCAESVDGV